MGKRIIKNNNLPCNKKHLNKLIKLLKPKVYITSYSNFKTLVQQLTGNGSISPISSIHHNSSLEESDHPTQNQGQLKHINDQDIMPSLDNSMLCQEMNFSEEYRKMESWLLEIDSCTNYDSYLSNNLHY